MNIYQIKKTTLLLALPALIAVGSITGCGDPQKKDKPETEQDTTAKKAPSSSQASLTLPALDALFYEKGFSASLKTQLGLTDEQIAKLKSAAHTSVADLSEDGTDAGSAREAAQAYREKLKEIIGDDKAQQLEQLVAQKYSEGLEGLAPTKPNFVPTDTRIVVNAPAFRMDVFQDGKLTKSYKVGIGYPEFPLPTGMRRADTIIFNPSWTPPDEPWVRGKFQPGVKVSGANEDNPLGVIKIPIGMPSLIHGGKELEKIGNFASHGCVGLTNAQVQDFTATVAQLGGLDITAEGIKAKKGSKTQSVKLKTSVPIDLRYETIVAQNGALHIYRDVYERGTNTLENAKQILSAYSIDYNSLTEPEKTALDAALDEMNRDPKGNAIAADSLAPAKDGVAATKVTRSKQGKVTRTIKGETEIAVPIASLQGKGYPEPVNLNTGGTGK